MSSLCCLYVVSMSSCCLKLSRTTRLGLALQEWRDQAGQGAVEGEMVVEGRGLVQWQEEVRVAVAGWNSQQDRGAGST